MEQIPTIGRIVHYRLSASDAERINRRRAFVVSNLLSWTRGAQAHVGSHVAEGDTFPMLIVLVCGSDSVVNGQVFLDGNDVFWATDVFWASCTVPGTYSWPTRA